MSKSNLRGQIYLLSIFGLDLSRSVIRPANGTFLHQKKKISLLLNAKILIPLADFSTKLLQCDSI